METMTHLVVSGSNIFGFVPIYSLFKTNRYYGALLVSGAVSASVLMHLTETKHNLPGLYLSKYSNAFLWLDRIVAWMTGLYGLYLFYTNPQKTIWQVILPVMGAISSLIGESTMNLPLYTLTHTIWHGLAYLSLYLVNH